MSIPIPGANGTRQPRIFILYASTGGGHLSAARALQAAIQLRHPGTYQVELINIPLVTDSQRVRMLYESYNLMLKADPRFAKHGMRLLNTFNVEKAVIPLVKRAYQNVRRMVEQERPDLIVSVHAILNHALTMALRDCHLQDRTPYVIVCTDLTNNFLRGWANPDATRIITFSEMARRQMLEYGVPAEKLEVHRGFTVHPSFFAEPVNRDAAREELGLNPRTFTLLISMGGVAIPRKTVAIVRELLRSELPLQLLVVCGMNPPLKRKMHFIARKAPIRMHVYGYTQRIALMMSAADLMISKPGPGTIMEAVIKELPLLLDNVTEPMPQEKGNLAFALDEGIAHPITSYRRLPYLVERLMRDTAEYRHMKENMRRIKHEDAIFDVAESVLSLLPPGGGQ